MNDRYIFDLDNTLVYTDKLNNEAYNYALNQYGLMPITECTRITKDVVFCKYPHLSDLKKQQIVKLKQDYFIGNVHFTTANTDLMDLLQSKNAEHCIMWTSADKKRVQALIKCYMIENAFKSIFYSNKYNVRQDVVKICKIFACNSKQLNFYEDDKNIIKELKLLGQKVFVELSLFM